mgnify:CR=1 FL=1
MKHIETNDQITPTVSKTKPINQKIVAVYRASLVKDETLSFMQANQYFSFADQSIIQQVYPEIP